MTYLLDTNVVSEWVKPRPDPHVVSWLADIDEDRVFLSVISLAEISRGIASMPVGVRRDRLAAWLADELPERFEGRLLPVNRPIAEAWGMLMSRAKQAGIGLGVMDAFFAATADTHGLTLVTRNTSDFARLGIMLLNPWHLPG
ncbi:MAG: toxin FitB [Thermomicrobiales bacterium]|nr:toxin FitB [Thermomicrobiales bacterium]